MLLFPIYVLYGQGSSIWIMLTCTASSTLTLLLIPLPCLPRFFAAGLVLGRLDIIVSARTSRAND